DLRAQTPRQLGQGEAKALDPRADDVALNPDRYRADLLRFAVCLAAADGRLFGGHRHEQRVLPLDRTMPGAHTEPSRTEHRDARAHVDGREPDTRERFG